MNIILTLVLATLCVNYSASQSPPLTINGTATNVAISNLDLIPKDLNDLSQSSLKSAYIEVDILTTVLTQTFTNINKTLPGFLIVSERAIKLVIVYVDCSLSTLQLTIDNLIRLIITAQTQTIRISCAILQILLNTINIRVNLLLQLISNLQQALSYAISIRSPLVPVIQQRLRSAVQQLEDALRQAINYGLQLLCCVANSSQPAIDQVVVYLASLQNSLENLLVLKIQTLVNSALTNDYLLPEEEDAIVTATQELTGIISTQLNVAKNPSQPISDSITKQLSGVRSQLQQTSDLITKQSSDTGSPTTAALKIPWKKVLHWIRVAIDLIDDAVNGP